jgi:hypothetical protein
MQVYWHNGKPKKNLHWQKSPNNCKFVEIHDG